MRETTGNEVGWECDESTGCHATLLDSTFVPTCPADSTPGYGTAWGRFFSLWTHCGISAWSTGDERLVACGTDDDCPNLYMYKDPADYECVRGLCQNIDEELYPRDELWPHHVAMLCLADIPRAETDNWLAPEVQHVEEIVSAACPSVDECHVPDECRQP